MVVRGRVASTSESLWEVRSEVECTECLFDGTRVVSRRRCLESSKGGTSKNDDGKTGILV